MPNTMRSSLYKRTIIIAARADLKSIRFRVLNKLCASPAVSLLMLRAKPCPAKSAEPYYPFLFLQIIYYVPIAALTIAEYSDIRLKTLFP